MSNPGLNIKHHKKRGEWAEMRFLARVSELGLTVTRPWGDSAPYDIIVESQGCWLRVQVKSTTHPRGNSYACPLHGGSSYYTTDDFDFVAAYVIPLNLWYIIPVEVAITGKDKLHINPGSSKNPYEQYREAWHLLKGKRCATTPAAADLCFRHGCQSRMEQLTPSQEDSDANVVPAETNQE